MPADNKNVLLFCEKTSFDFIN